MTLILKDLGIDTHKDHVVFMHKNCYVCSSEGFEVKSRLRIKLGNKSIIATLNIISSDILTPNEVSLSKYAWECLDAKEGDKITITHAAYLDSLKFLRAKMYGNELNYQQITCARTNN